MDKILLASALLAPAKALAYSASDVANAVSEPIGSSGIIPSDFGAIFLLVAGQFTLLVKAIAVLIIARAALLFIIEQSEGELEKFKKAIISALVAIVLIGIADPVSKALFSGANANIISDPVSSSGLISEQIYGIISYIEVPVAIIAMLMIIVSGIRCVLSYGTGEGVTHLRRTVISVLIGIFLMVIKGAVVESFWETGEPGSVLSAINGAVSVIIGFTALLATLTLIYSGIMMIINVGKEDQFEKAKGLLIRVLIGLAVIAVSAALAKIFLI